MNFDVYVGVFCHLVFVYRFEFVFSCQPWGYIIYTAKNTQPVTMLMKTSLNNILLPYCSWLLTILLFSIVHLNNIVNNHVGTIWAAKYCSGPASSPGSNSDARVPTQAVNGAANQSAWRRGWFRPIFNNIVTYVLYTGYMYFM
jgi:hypothetical protein